MRPIIAITCGRKQADPGVGPRVRPGRMQVALDESVVLRVREAGGVGMVLPPGDAGALDTLCTFIDGIIVTGGAFDIDPRLYGETISGRHDGADPARTELELASVRFAQARQIPLLGICGGMQAMAVALGGSLIQDLAVDRPGSLDHEQATDPAFVAHGLIVEPAWVSRLPSAVNSTHHQAVDRLGALEVIARAPDGVIEAVSLPGQVFMVGVQWHPELLDGALIHQLADAARTYRGSRR